MKDWVKHSNHLGIFLAFLFVIIFVWQWIHPTSQEFGNQFLNFWFFGYGGNVVVGVFLGIVQSFIWGYIFTGLWHLACWCKK